MMRKVVPAFAFVLLVLFSVPALAWLFRINGGPGPNAPPQTISAINLSGMNFTGGAPSGTMVGNLSATMSPASPPFSGSFSLGTAVGCTSTRNSSFQIVGNALETNGVLTAGGYDICVLATQGTLSKSQHFVITGSTPGSVIATETERNDAAVTMPSGMPVVIGQAFRRGDVPAGNCVALTDSAGNPLTYQLDEIATRRENSDDGSIRHLVASVKINSAVASGATFQFKYALTGAPCASPSATHTLADLCAQHDFKLHLTDVRNQNDSLRGSGSWTFRVCDNISNVGRDAPRQVAKGLVRDTYIVSGAPTDDTGGAKDPMLYVSAYLDLFTDPSNPSNLLVRWVFWVHSPWMNVAAGSAGNPGAPGPVGLANDPQAISYRPEVFDGTTSILNWNALDATLNSASNPVQSTGCGADFQSNIPFCLNVPSSTGANAWYYGQAVRITSTGTPVGGLTNGSLKFVYNAGSSNFSCGDQNIVSLQDTPQLDAGPETIQSGSQGSGSTTFSFRVWHTHNMGWLTLDSTTQENWTGANAHWAFDPAFTSAEKTYWEETGTMIPINFTQPNPAVPIQCQIGLDINYHPLGRDLVVGGTGPGDRPDLGVINEFAAQAFISQLPSDQQYARNYTASTAHYAWGDWLNEATGRVPAVNNGPPIGPGGNGTGTSYPQLGAPLPHVQTQIGGYVGLAYPLQGVPVVGHDYSAGMWGNGSGNYVSHEPSYEGMTYLFYGSRHWLDLMYDHVNRGMVDNNIGPCLGNCKEDVEGGNHYYALFAHGGFQRRGSFWTERTIVTCAALGADGNAERSYCNDMLSENNNYYPLFLAAKDGTSTNWRSAIAPPNSDDYITDPFIDSYGVTTTYLAWAMLHAPLAQTWLTKWATFYEHNCGQDEVSTNGPVSAFWCGVFTYTAAVHDGGHKLSGNSNVGQYINGTDDSDFGNYSTDMTFTTGSPTIGNPLAFLPWPMTNGDLVKSVNAAFYGPAGPDQLNTATWYRMINVNNVAGTFQIENPATPGVAFPSYTIGGNPIGSGTYGITVRSVNTPGPTTGYFDYGWAVGEIVYGLKILGYSVADAYNIAIARGMETDILPAQNAHEPSRWWNPNIIVP